MVEVVEVHHSHTTVRGTAADVAKVAKELGLANGNASQVINMPTKPTAVQEPAKEPKSTRGGGRGRGKKPAEDKPAVDEAKVVPKPAPKPTTAAAPEPEPEPPAPEAEPEQVDDAPGVAVAAAGETYEGVDAASDELQNARRLRDVIQYLQGAGYNSLKDIVTICDGIKPDVPLLKRVGNMEERVTAAFNLLEENAANG